METKSKLTQVLLGIIVGVLMIQLAFQAGALLSKFLADKAPAQPTKEQVFRQEYLQAFLDATKARTDSYETAVYDNAAVTTIYQQQLITLAYIFKELNAQTILMVQEQMGK